VSRRSSASGRRTGQNGFIPTAVGLILAIGWVMAQAAAANWLAVAIAAGAAVFVVMSGRSPLWSILVGPIISGAAAQF
jgi:hypothetical protein